MNTCFIGGTGRSGTSILKKIISQHSQAISIPIESRFAVDPDGIFDFYRSYSTGWSPYYADQKIKRLFSLLENLGASSSHHRIFYYLLKVCGYFGVSITSKQYHNIQLNNYIPNYSTIINELKNNLIEFQYYGARLGSPSYKLKNKLIYANPYSKDDLKKLFREFFQNILDDLNQGQNKDLYVDDNTWNILFASDIIDLMPSPKIISVIRDPRDVVSSLSRQKWMPIEKENTAKIYNGLISQWIKIRHSLKPDFWFEIKLEDLVKNPRDQLINICEFINVPFEENLLKIDLSKANIGRWESDFTENEKDRVLPLLEKNINLLGYEYR